MVRVVGFHHSTRRSHFGSSKGLKSQHMANSDIEHELDAAFPVFNSAYAPSEPEVSDELSLGASIVQRLRRLPQRGAEVVRE